MAIISASFNCYLRNKFTLAKYSMIWGNNTQWVMFHLHSLNFTIKISKLWRLVEIAFEMFLFLNYFQLRTIWVYSTQVPSLIREHGTTTLPFLLRPLFLWTPAFHPPTHFVHTSLLPGTHTRWGIFRSKNAPQPLQFKTHDERKTATQLVTPSPPFPKNMLVLWYLIMILI